MSMLFSVFVYVILKKAPCADFALHSAVKTDVDL